MCARLEWKFPELPTTFAQLWPHSDIFLHSYATILKGLNHIQSKIMYYEGLFVHLLIVVDGSWYVYHCLLHHKTEQSNDKIFMLIARVFHDYLMNSHWRTVDDLKCERSTTDEHGKLNRCFSWFYREPLAPLPGDNISSSNLLRCDLVLSGPTGPWRHKSDLNRCF